MAGLSHEEYMREVAASRARAEKRLMEAKRILEAEERERLSRVRRPPQYDGRLQPPRRELKRDPRPLIKKPARKRLGRRHVVGKRKASTLARPGDVLAKCHPEYPHYAKGLCRRCYSKAQHRKKKLER